MIRTIIWLILAAIFLIIMLPFGLVLRLVQLIRGDKYADPPKLIIWICTKVVPIYTRLAGCDYTVIGKENIPDEAAVFAGNHQGIADTILNLFVFNGPKVIIAKQEAQNVPIASLFMNLLNCIFIDRKNPRKAHEAIMKAIDFLKNGKSILIFPEGTRSRGPHMNHFKHGAFKAAIDAGVPVVPFVFEGTYKVFEENWCCTKAPCMISILPKMYALPDEKPAAFAARVQSVIAAELERLRNE